MANPISGFYSTRVAILILTLVFIIESLSGCGYTQLDQTPPRQQTIAADDPNAIIIRPELQPVVMVNDTADIRVPYFVIDTLVSADARDGGEEHALQELILKAAKAGADGITFVRYSPYERQWEDAPRPETGTRASGLLFAYGNNVILCDSGALLLRLDRELIQPGWRHHVSIARHDGSNFARTYEVSDRFTFDPIDYESGLYSLRFSGQTNIHLFPVWDTGQLVTSYVTTKWVEVRPGEKRQ